MNRIISLRELILGVEALCELVLAKLKSKTLSIDKIENSGRIAYSNSNGSIIEDSVRIINGISRRSCISFTCLHKSIALFRILSRRNYRAKIIFGVEKNFGKGSFSAHAWVHADGRDYSWGVPIEQFQALCLPKTFLNDRTLMERP